MYSNPPFLWQNAIDGVGLQRKISKYFHKCDAKIQAETVKCAFGIYNKCELNLFYGFFRIVAGVAEQGLANRIRRRDRKFAHFYRGIIAIASFAEREDALEQRTIYHPEVGDDVGLSLGIETAH